MPPVPNPNADIYLFSLGREPLLSVAELAAVFSMRGIRHQINYNDDKFIEVSLSQVIQPEEFIKRVGGTIKISTLFPRLSPTADSIAEHLYATIPDGKITFSLLAAPAGLALQIKKILKNKGRSIRYVEPKNTATTFHNRLVEKGEELTILNNKVYLTKAIQPFEDLGERDFGRPGRDDRSGMLPPKLAMMMINLSSPPPPARGGQARGPVAPSPFQGEGGRGLPSVQAAESTAPNTRDLTLLDPFCGSGTILTEGILLGYKNLIGFDISNKAVLDTKKNIEWTRKNFQFPISNEKLRGNLVALRNFQSKPNVKIQIEQSDVKELNKKIAPMSVDAIVTEPYLGKPLRGRETREELTGQANELKKLYLDSFVEFKKVLKPDGVVVIIIPRYRYRNEWININCVEEIKKAGFKIQPLLPDHEYLFYARPNQLVGREIWRFIKN